MKLLAATVLTIAALGSTTACAGEVADNVRIAQLLEQDQTDRKGFPNTALSWKEINVRDEAMVKRGRPQWYGIQPKINEGGRIEGRHPIDEGAVTDQERARFQVKPLAEIRRLENGSARVQP